MTPLKVLFVGGTGILSSCTCRPTPSPLSTPTHGPVERGAREIVAWHDEDPSRRQVDARLDALMDRLVEAHRVR